MVAEIVVRHMRMHHIKVRGLAVECLLRCVINLTRMCNVACTLAISCLDC